MKPPIPDPFESPAAEGADRVFYPSFWALFVRNVAIMHLTMGVGLVLTMGPALSPARASRDGLDFVLNVALIACPTLMALAETISAVFLKAVTVSPEGLTVRGRWWRPRTLAWDEIKTVKRARGLFPEIIITGAPRKTPVTLLLLFRERDAFVRTVKEHSNEDNSLRVYLVEHGY